MDTTFVYNKAVTGKNNIGRRGDMGILANLLAQGENVAIYEPENTGKMSLILQTFYNMKVSGQRFTPVEFSLLNVRTVADLMMRLGSTLIKGAGFGPDEYAQAVERYLSGTHFVFDPEVYEAKGQIISLNWDIDDSDINAILALPYRIARDRNQKLYVVLCDFQNIMLTEDGTRVCKILQGIFEKLQPEHRMWSSYIFVGSQVNAMKEIFEQRKLFYRRVEHLKISQLEAREIIDHILRGFMSTGKVIDRELMLGVCKLFRCNIWYINHFAAICDSLSKGYIMEPVLVEALDVLIAVHRPEFEKTMNDLTTYQICLLRAILDGYTKFSSSEVISRYNLNSSANVRRLRDALVKKEIITFDEKDEPQIMDPLFEYWVRRDFFEITGE